MRIGDSFSNDKPIYLQIVERIKIEIVSGDLKQGEKLDSVRDIAAEAKVNPNTVQRALSELEKTGLVYAHRTSGRFVTDNTDLIERTREEMAREKLEAFVESMKLLGYEKKKIVEMLREDKT